MAIDYIIFIHGVKTRDRSKYELQAMQMFDRINAHVKPNPARTYKPIFLFWGDIAKDSIDTLNSGLNNSPTWKDFWFKDLREEQFIPFIGDAALYLSRNVSVKIIKQMTAQALQQMGVSLDEIKQQPRQAGDRLHLVTHSWGTVILFDIMFAPRWEDKTLPADILEAVDNIRSSFFGIGKPEIKEFGIPIASIHTMGSPISLFNLLNASGAQSFNLTPRLKDFLSSLHTITGKPLPWRNYAHPGDPIAYPLKGVIDLSLDEAKAFVEIEDIMSPTNPFLEAIGKNALSIFQLLHGGEAHGSYWTDPSVAKRIGEAI